MDNVTIILPVYNAQKTLFECIESIRQQTFKDWKLIIVNDGSTDNTSNIIKGFSDKRISCASHSKNLGLVSALNTALSLCQSRIIFRMDSDDLMLPDRIKIQLAQIRTGGIGVYSNSILLNGKLQDGNDFGPMQVEQLLAFSNPINHPTVMFDRSYIGEFQYKQVTCEDYELWCRLATQSVKFSCHKEPVLNYRTSKTQKSVLEKHTVAQDACKIARGYLREKDSTNFKELEEIGFTFSDRAKLSLLFSVYFRNIVKPYWSDLKVQSIFMSKLRRKMVKNAFRL